MKAVALCFFVQGEPADAPDAAGCEIQIERLNEKLCREAGQKTL